MTSGSFSLPRVCAPALLLVLACTAAGFSRGAQKPAGFDVFAVMQEFDRMAATPLWPNFHPAQTPIAIYDGTRTWLFRHPSPPPEFLPVAAHPGVAAAAGRYAEVTANTSTEIGGVLTATALLDSSSASARKQAALLVHEVFHVYQQAHHPDWTANEAMLFVYPVDNPDLLSWRRMESEALRRALEAQDTRSACWTRAALDMRLRRFAQLGPDYLAYERHTELNEGLAQYVEDRAFGSVRDDLMPAAGFAAGAVRQRAYASGEALALLLDRFAPGWREQLDRGQSQFLDQLLAARMAGATACEFYPAEVKQARQRAVDDVQKLQADRQRMLQDFQTRPGWRVVVEASRPMSSQGFDPLNLTVVGRGLVLHRRFLKAGGPGVSIEVMNGQALTEAAGEHPMFSGFRRITLAGFASEPAVTEKDQAVTLSAAGVKASFAAAKVQRDPRARQITISF